MAASGGIHADLDLKLVAQDEVSLYDPGKVVVDAAAEAGVLHIVRSSLPHSGAISDGLISIDYFDGMP